MAYTLKYFNKITKHQRKRFTSATKIYKFFRINRWKRIFNFEEIQVIFNPCFIGVPKPLPIRLIYYIYHEKKWFMNTGYIYNCGYQDYVGNTEIFFDKNIEINIYNNLPIHTELRHTLFHDDFYTKKQSLSVEISKFYFKYINYASENMSDMYTSKEILI